MDINPNWFLRARLKTRQLLLLIALDEQRNIHRASEELHMTQPAASKQLKDLEEMLGVQLFDRLPRGMEPTIYGETMIRHARMALNSLSLAHEDIVAIKAGLAGQVDIGTIMTPGIALLPQAITRTKQAAPHLRIGVEMEQSNVLIEQLQRGRLDFMIGRIPERQSAEGFSYEELGDEPACAVVRPGHPLLAQRKLQLRDISTQPWILPPQGSILRSRCELMFRRAGLDVPVNVIDTTAMLMIKPLLQQTDALNVMPVAVAQYYEAQGVLAILPIELPCRMDGYGIIMVDGHLMSPGAQLLLRHVRDVARGV
ncbi:LysR family transcriptional regulator [Duganella sp. Leaf126]|uniref:LysR family transcriptional regulator n=1 Tax=Duganella sp. Leaf126 TaxID=1736266 RepID=UPI0006F8E70F|nr:LysR family transcriptional regulator [Duganella sp. Leaf126]KQQ40520.1 LysR family transcriptional regulator [Duganella sp. Leaf126]